MDATGYGRELRLLEDENRRLRISEAVAVALDRYIGSFVGGRYVDEINPYEAWYCDVIPAFETWRDARGLAATATETRDG